MEDDTHYTPEGEEEYKTIEVEDWEEKAEAMTDWANETMTNRKYEVALAVMVLTALPPQFVLVVWAYFAYRAYKRGFLFSNKFVKEAKVQK